MSDQNIEAIYPLTPLQEGILFHSLDSRRPHVYFNQYTCILHGSIDVPSLKAAFADVVARHAALRTLFTWERREKPLQLVRREVELSWQILDWRADTDDRQRQRLDSFLQLDRDKGFRLDRAPMMRLALVHLAPERARLIWSFHHILMDGWSLRLLLDEVKSLYAARARGEKAMLPPAPAFQDFIQWLGRRDRSRDEAFWTAQLAGFDLPTCPDVATGAANRSGDLTGRTQEIELDQELVARLVQAGKQCRVTMNTIIASAWSLLLSRYCDSQDVVFGATVAGRPVDLEGAARTAGLFINTLPVRVSVPPDAGVRQLFKDVQSLQATLSAFEQTSLQDILHCSELSGNTPLFETILVFENVPSYSAESAPVGSFSISEERFIERSNFPLAILAVPEDRFKLIAVFDGGRFSDEAIARLLRHLTEILHRFVEHPERPLRDIDILPRDERRKILEDWNDTGSQASVDKTVVDLIERCAEKSPEAVAVTAGDGKLTYDELNRSANRIAHRLLREAATNVVVYTERTGDAIVAMVGALKAGVHYVPLDIRDPADRLDQILEDAVRHTADSGGQARPVVATQSHLLDRVPSGVASPLVLDGELGGVPDHNPSIGLRPESLAYIIYTSGSTGRPKGVMVSHGNLMNSTCARFEYYDESVSAYALLSSLATDSSIAGIYWTLATGGNLVMPGDRAELDIEQLAILIRDQEVSHTLCVPSLYALLLENADPALLGSLRTIIVAGEACAASLVRRHFEVLPEATLFNEYGPSEACVWASVDKLDERSARSGITIGRPIANTRLYVLDSQMRPVPVGVTGELYIGGANVSQGYFGDVEATRLAFVADPFSSRAADRLYRTGDRVRYRDDGRIEFLGRVDHQIKVRGFRVEPGEIESTLASHRDVQSAVVFMARDPVDDSELDELLALVGDSEAERALSAVEALEDGEAVGALERSRNSVST